MHSHDIFFSPGKDWSPALTVKTICMSIMSMLASNTQKITPPDNEQYVRMYQNRSPKDSNFVYHDDKV